MSGNYLRLNFESDIGKSTSQLAYTVSLLCLHSKPLGNLKFNLVFNLWIGTFQILIVQKWYLWTIKFDTGRANLFAKFLGSLLVFLLVYVSLQAHKVIFQSNLMKINEQNAELFNF